MVIFRLIERLQKSDGLVVDIVCQIVKRGENNCFLCKLILLNHYYDFHGNVKFPKKYHIFLKNLVL